MRRNWGHLARDIGGTLSGWVKGQALILLWLTGMYAVGYGLLDVPLWPLVAPLAALLHLVPMIGPILGMLIPLGLTWLGGGDAWHILGVLGVYVLAQGIEGFVLTPRIMGRRVRLRPLVVFFAVLAGGMMFGFFGMLLAVPAAAVAMVVWRFFQAPPASER